MITVQKKLYIRTLPYVRTSEVCLCSAGSPFPRQNQNIRYSRQPLLAQVPFIQWKPAETIVVCNDLRGVSESQANYLFFEEQEHCLLL